METAIYCRVSTDEQAQEGFSIRAQEQKLKEYANVKDWSIFNIYMDEGISGKNITERPAITRMIEDIKAGRVKNVLVTTMITKFLCCTANAPKGILHLRIFTPT